MNIVKHRTRHDEALIPCAAVRPRGVAASRLGCEPGDSRRVLDELRAETAPLQPLAFRRSFHHGTWLPASVGLRRVDPARVRLDDPATIGENVAAILATAPAALASGTGLTADLLGLALQQIATTLDEPVEEFWYDNRLDRTTGVRVDANEALAVVDADVWTAINGYPIDYRFALASAFDDFDELGEALSDEILMAYGVYDAEAADIELYAIEVGLPMHAEVTA